MRRFLLSLLLKIYKPKVIAVWGAYAREEARVMIEAVLGAHMWVCSAPDAMLLQVLWENCGGFRGAMNALADYSLNTCPQVIVISGRPDESGYKFLKRTRGIDIVAITPMEDIPSFSDVFSASSRKVAPYIKELNTLEPNTWLALNYDDEAVRACDEKTNLHRLIYGISAEAELYAGEIRAHIDTQENGEILSGIYGKAHREGVMVPFRIPGVLGKRHIYAALAAIAVVSQIKKNIMEAVEGFARYDPPVGSGRVLLGVKHSILIDASIHASPFLVRELVEIIEELTRTRSKGRTVVVLGDLVGFGEGEEVQKIHQSIGVWLGRIAQEAYLVGERVLFTEDVMRQELGEDHVRRFVTIEELSRTLQNDLQEGDWVLILGSAPMHMETIVEELRGDANVRGQREENAID